MRSILKLPRVALGARLGAGLGAAALGAIALHGLHAQAAESVPVYVINEITVHDPAAFATYAKRQGALIAQFGGTFLARGGKAESLDGPPLGQRIAIYMFRSAAQEQAWHHAPEQKDLAALRDKSSDFRSFAVEGCADCKPPGG